jgi:hypothetical protein
MDKITDILTTFFVNSKKTDDKNKKVIEKTDDTVNSSHNSNKSLEKNTDNKSSDNKSSDTTSSDTTSSDKTSSDKTSSDKTSSDTTSSDTTSSDTKSSDTTQNIFSNNSNQYKSKTFKKQSLSKDDVKDDVRDDVKDDVKDDIDDVKDDVKDDVRDDVKDDVKDDVRDDVDDVKDDVDDDIKDDAYSDLSSLKSEGQKENKKVLKKYILKPSEFYKKNIMIINETINDNISFLGDFLYKLSLMKDVTSIYDNDIHIITSSENKKLYKQMLLDNPYLYFTNFDVKQTFIKKKLNELDSNSLRTLYIIDNNMLINNTDVLKTLLDKNVQIIIISNEDDKSSLDSYKLLGNNRLMIHKPNKLKLIQKRFYKNYIKKLCNIQSFDDYYDIINDENLDVKYIILKDTELRYN